MVGIQYRGHKANLFSAKYFHVVTQLYIISSYLKQSSPFYEETHIFTDIFRRNNETYSLVLHI